MHTGIHPKTDNTIHIVYENLNGLSLWFPNNNKITLAKVFMKSVNADCYLGTENKSQWKLLSYQQQLSQGFINTNKTNDITSHNTYTQSQQGGTSILLFDMLVSYGKKLQSDKLGCWCSVELEHDDGRVVRILVAYHSNISNKVQLNASYNQQKHYFCSIGDYCCLLDIFKADLDALLQEWHM